MAFATSTVPLEFNLEYIQSSKFSYAMFSQWFNEVKVKLDSGENVTHLKSDRLEATYDQNGTFLQLTLCPSGFNLTSLPEVRAKFESSFGDFKCSYPVPNMAENESKDEVTKRWVMAMHESIRDKISQLKLRLRWFEFSFSPEDEILTTPPNLMAP
jgi:hypothetical protein